MVPNEARNEPRSVASAHPLTVRMIGFLDLLRLNGFVLGPAETGAALSQVAGTVGDRDADRRRLKVLLTSRREEWESFDDLFEAYWLRRGRERRKWQKADMAAVTPDELPPAWRHHFRDGDDIAADAAPQIETEGSGKEGGAATGRLVASANAARERTDFRHFVDAAEIAEAENLAYRLASAIRHRLSRRRRIAKKGSALDLRRTIRANLHRGGEPIDLRRKSVPDRPMRIVVFLDVSGSMKHYSRFFLQFVKGLVGTWAETDAYLIHTRLVHVTDALRDKDPMRAMTRLALLAEGFGGGTRIGDCLRVFNERHAKKAINSRTVAIVLSDGYDVGPAAELAAELARLKKRARRLVWLNPLLGWRDYQPVTAAIAAAMPHIDHFAAANTPAALAALEPELARL